MSERQRIGLLILILGTVALAASGVSTALLYRAAFREQQERLVETAQSQARLMEAIARFDVVESQDYPGGATAATLSQIIEAHERYRRSGGKTGELVLARREGEEMVFLMRHTHDDLPLPRPVRFDSGLAEPMRLSLSGRSGVVVGLDYRGRTVLAAHEPVAELDLGIVAKIDLAEVRAPFVRAGVIAAACGLLAVALGALLFLRVTNPLLRQLEDGERRYRNALDAMMEGCQVIGFDWRYLYVNDAVSAHARRDREALLGRTMMEAYPGIEETAVFEAFRRCMEERVSRRLETEFVFPDGSTAWFDLSIQPVSEGISILSVDITARKQAEKVLKEHSEQLERMVAERTRELEEAQERMVRQERLAVLGQLAGGVGHELRNPLGVISNAVYYLERVLSNADEETRKYLGIISAEVRSADGIISGLLDFTRVKPMNRERVDLPELLSRVMEKQAKPEEIEVVTEMSPELPAVRVDPGQLEQVFANLVTNACQAMAGDGRLTIRAQRIQDRVAVSVEDTGCGIPEESMGKVFEPLFTTKARGIGLGLAISRNLVEANGGAIEVASGEEGGSTFTVFLPFEEATV